MSDNCIFCKIIKGDIPCKKLFENDQVIAFEDINPIAPEHFLVIPKTHIPTLDDTDESHKQLLGEMMIQAAQIAKEKGIGQSGYRQIINCRESAGQVVFHLHLHVAGGRKMGSMG